MDQVREIPTFEGRKVDGRELKLSGSLAQLASLDDAHQIGDEIVVIGVYTVDKITHKATPKSGFLRVEASSAIELHVVTDSTAALDVLHKARSDDQAALDELLGRSPLPFADDAFGADKTTVTDAGLHRLIDSATGEITDADPESEPEPAADDYEQRLRDAIADPITKPAEAPEETETPPGE